MKYSEDRIKTLAKSIHDRLYLDEDVNYKDEDKSLNLIKKTMLAYFQMEDKIDEIVKAKIETLKKRIIPGTDEWNILYRKYFEEEMRKHGQ